MGRSDSTKERILAIERMFKTGKVWTVETIQNELSVKYGITVERKTVYADIKSLDKFIPIVKVQRCRYQLEEAFNESKKFTVDTSLCKTCFFYRAAGRDWTCDYLLITGCRRPCPGGRDCTVYKKRTKRRNRDIPGDLT